MPVTLTQAFQVFDSVMPPQPDWFTIDLSVPGGTRVGVPVDCGVPVVLRTSDGRAKLVCLVCGLEIAEIAGQWMIVEWGKRGIRMPGAPRHPAPGVPS